MVSCGFIMVLEWFEGGFAGFVVVLGCFLSWFFVVVELWLLEDVYRGAIVVFGFKVAFW